MDQKKQQQGNEGRQQERPASHPGGAPERGGQPGRNQQDRPQSQQGEQRNERDQGRQDRPQGQNQQADRSQQQEGRNQSRDSQQRH